jgi:imidazolonepropionase-like amidohydrolase
MTVSGAPSVEARALRTAPGRSRRRRIARRVTAIAAAVVVLALVAATAWAYRWGYVDAPWRRPVIATLAVEPVAAAVAFVGVTVVSMHDEQVLADHTVVVRDGVIDQVGPATDVAVPADAVVVDGRGHTLVPGLIDMHVHVQHPDELLLFAAYGVTTVRNMGANQGAIRWMGFPDQARLRDQVAAGDLLGPRIVTAGPILEGRPAANPFMTVVETPEEAASYVAEQAVGGYDFVKTYDAIDADVFTVVLDAAAEHGLPVAGHVPDTLDVTDVLGRLHTIEHLDGYIDPDGATLLVDEADLPAVAAATAASGTWNVPTMVLWQKRIATTSVTGQPEVASVPPRIQRVWQDFARRMEASITYDGDDYAAQMLRLQNLVIAALRDAGAGILLGTDTDNAYVVPGYSAHEELGLLTGAGLSPYEALSAATRDAATALGLDDDIGTITVGKRADLLLTVGDPLDDITRLRDPAGVMLDGRWLPRERLDEIVHQLGDPPSPGGRS